MTTKGPPEDQEEELDLDVMREKRRQYLQQKEESKQKLKTKSEKGSVTGKNTPQDEANEDDREVTWGFGKFHLKGLKYLKIYTNSVKVEFSKKTSYIK